MLTYLLAFALVIDEPFVLRDEECGIVVTLPSSSWKLSNVSQTAGESILRIYSPEDPPVLRIVILQNHKSESPRGLVGRLEQISPGLEQKAQITSATLGELPAERAEYEMYGMRSVELGVTRGDLFQVIQVNAPSAKWEGESGKELLDIFDSIELIPFKARATSGAVPAYDPTTPEEVRNARAAPSDAAATFSVRSHEVRVRIDPEEERLSCDDALQVEALADEVSELRLYQSHLSIDRLVIGDQPLSHAMNEAGELAVVLPRPLKRGEIVRLSYSGHADPFLMAYPQELIAEIEILGQVLPHSSYSSHVYYYPTDALNDASVRLTLDVPDSYVAVSGGRFLGKTVDAGRASYSYEMTERRPRLLPLGFAAGQFEKSSVSVDENLEIELYCPPALAERAKVQLGLARDAARCMTRLMGPLPWNRIAMAVVEPKRKDTAVSLPGLILLSPVFFQDLTTIQPSGAALSDPRMTSWLLIPDELSHQWNVYKAQLPNELGEGISTFTNLVFLGEQAGEKEYQSGVASCARAYKTMATAALDVALANPKLYQSSVYRVVAFCKVPVVLHQLRMRLGEEIFFDGFRHAMETADDRKTSYDQFREAFEEVSGEDLGVFFDDWFFRAGRPALSVEWSSLSLDGRAGIQIDFTQLQDGEPFEIDFEVDVETVDGNRSRLPVALRKRQDSLTWPLASEASAVIVDPEGTALLETHSLKNR